METFSTDNNGIKYLLTVTDIFSKCVWIFPLRRKTGQDFASAFSRILKERKPNKMWVDKGREFYNKDVQNLADLNSAETEQKSCVIDKFNSTIMENMFKYLSANNKGIFVDVLDLLVDQYNNTIHSSLKMTTNEASRKETETKCGEIYIDNLVVRLWLQNVRLVVMLE